MNMLTSKEYLEKSFARLNTADHILTVTHPTVQSPRLLLSATEHLFLAMDYAMNAILASELLKNTISPFNNSFSSRYSTFRLKIANKRGFSKTGIEQLKYLRNILSEHQKAQWNLRGTNPLLFATTNTI